MKRKIVYLIGIIFLALVVWGATYFALQYCEKNLNKEYKTNIYQQAKQIKLEKNCMFF